MATREQIRNILQSNDFSDGEKFVVRAQFRGFIEMGNFEEKLWELLCAADANNRARLRIAFPNETDGYICFAYGDLGKRVRDAGCPI